MSLPNVTFPKCGACLKEIINEDFVNCAFENCRKPFHTDLCIGGPIPDENQKCNWICPKCRYAIKRTGPNCTTPVRALDSQEQLNVTFRRKMNPASTEAGSPSQNNISYDRFEALLDSKLDAIRSSIALDFHHAIEKLQKEVKDEMASLNSRLLRVETESEKLKTEFEKQKTSLPLTSENMEFQEVISQLRAELNEREQISLENVLEIAGIPETNGESLMHLTGAVAAKLGVQIDDRDVIRVVRAGPRLLQATSANGPSPRPRPIVLHLARRAIKDDLMKGFRVRRGANSADMGLPPHEPRPFYINERLTKENRALFGKAKEMGRKHGWRFVWTKEGKIMAKRNEDAPYFKIRGEKDLDRVFGGHLDISSHKK